MWKLCFGIVFIISLTIFILDNQKNSFPVEEYKEVRLLSYIPPLDLNSVKVEMMMVSLKKVDFFNETNHLDKYVEVEDFVPVIDKILHIPKGYHAYSHTG